MVAVVKKELLAMRPLDATPEMMKLASEDTLQKEVHSYGSGSYTIERYQYGLFLRCLVENDVLKTAVFLSEHLRVNARQPAYEVYVDRKGKCTLTYDRIENKWRTAKLDRINWPRSVWNAMSNWISPEDNAALKQYLGVDKDGYAGLLNYQRALETERQEIRNKKKTDVWDADLAGMPPLPKDWTRWIDKVGIPQNYMFYSYKKRGAQYGYCTFCGKDVPLTERPRYNREGRCSRCRHTVTFKSIGRAGRIFTETFSVYLLQPFRDGFILREFQVQRYYPKGEYRTPKVCCTECRRTVYDQKMDPRPYYWGVYKQQHLRWIAGERQQSYYGYAVYYQIAQAGRIYGKTLPYLAKTVLKPTGLVDWLYRQELTAAPDDYLYVLEKIPQLEQISKAGLPRLEKECFINRRRVSRQIKDKGASSLTRALGLDSQGLARLRKYNGGCMFLGWLQLEKESGKPISDEVICWFCERDYKTSDFQFILDRMNALQIRNYLLRQSGDNEESVDQVLTTWKDYLSMAEQLGIDTNDEIVYRASRLRQRHDELVLRMEQGNNEEQAAKVLETFPDVDRICQSIKEKFEYVGEEYAVVAPDGALDIIVEGNMLHHCVGRSDRYWERIERQEAYILFLRKASAPHLPYYTLEIEPNGTIRQKRTMYDRQNPDIKAAMEFLTEWQQIVAQRLTAGDRKKAMDSRILREQEFQQLRRDNVLIRAGELAGQKLADVLEADLMETAA